MSGHVLIAPIRSTQSIQEQPTWNSGSSALFIIMYGADTLRFFHIFNCFHDVARARQRPSPAKVCHHNIVQQKLRLIELHHLVQ
jgi:hypothetical protein